MKSSDNYDTSKNKELVVYSPDLKSINEKMVERGFAFPKPFYDDPEISPKIKFAFDKSVKKRKGLWRVGQLTGGNIQKNPVTESIQEKIPEAETKPAETETKPAEADEKKSKPDEVN